MKVFALIMTMLLMALSFETLAQNLEKHTNITRAQYHCSGMGGNVAISLIEGKAWYADSDKFQTGVEHTIVRNESRSFGCKTRRSLTVVRTLPDHTKMEGDVTPPQFNAVLQTECSSSLADSKITLTTDNGSILTCSTNLIGGGGSRYRDLPLYE